MGRRPADRSVIIIVEYQQEMGSKALKKAPVKNFSVSFLNVAVNCSLIPDFGFRLFWCLPVTGFLGLLPSAVLSCWTALPSAAAPCRLHQTPDSCEL